MYCQNENKNENNRESFQNCRTNLEDLFADHLGTFRNSESLDAPEELV